MLNQPLDIPHMCETHKVLMFYSESYSSDSEWEHTLGSHGLMLKALNCKHEEPD